MPQIHRFSRRRTRVAVGAEHQGAPGRDRRHLGGVRGGCAGADQRAGAAGRGTGLLGLQWIDMMDMDGEMGVSL
jgi:hypothetical protein